MSLINRFLKNQSGATAIEYGLIASLIAVVIIGGATLLGDNIDATFTEIATSIGGAAEAPAGGGEETPAE